jgi:hypothetical protein
MAAKHNFAEMKRRRDLGASAPPLSSKEALSPAPSKRAAGNAVGRLQYSKQERLLEADRLAGRQASADHGTSRLHVMS